MRSRAREAYPPPRCLMRTGRCFEPQLKIMKAHVDISYLANQSGCPPVSSNQSAHATDLLAGWRDSCALLCVFLSYEAWFLMITFLALIGVCLSILLHVDLKEVVLCDGLANGATAF